MKNSTPFFSIVLPTYNRCHFLSRSIESVLGQTFSDWELIIVDDGSTDDTKTMVTSYTDKRIKYIWQPNKERSSARNLGISKARGKFMCFLDSDDEYIAHHLETHHTAIVNNPAIKVFRTGLLYLKDNVCFNKSLNRPGAFLDHYPFEHSVYFSFHHSVFDNIKFDERFFIMEDMHLLLRVGKRYEIKQINDWTYIYHFNLENSGGLGKKYERILINKKACLNDMLHFSDGPVKFYIKWTICVSEILLAFGHMNAQKRKIPMSIVGNANVFFRFPLIYLNVTFRIIYVKFGEWSGLYRNEYRF